MDSAGAAGLPEDPETVAALCALAGPRRGDRVALAGATGRAGRALLAGAGAAVPVPDGARVALAAPGAEEAGRAALAPGGRLVGLAADRAGAAAVAASLGLGLRHLADLPVGVAWVAAAP